MTPTQVDAALKQLGWRIRNTTDRAAAVTDFQRGWNLGPALVIDGKAGSKTQAALTLSLKNKTAGKGTASEHFSFAEFACKCGGRYATCRRIRLHRGLASSLEKLRTASGGAIEVVSGYRCPRHNDAVGGASSSQHLYGAACDISPVLRTAKVAGLRAFAGIGYKRSNGLVSHVDRRDLSGNNTTGGTVDRPTTWVYAS